MKSYIKTVMLVKSCCSDLAPYAGEKSQICTTVNQLHGVESTSESASRSADQEIPHFLCNPAIYSRDKRARH